MVLLWFSKASTPESVPTMIAPALAGVPAPKEKVLSSTCLKVEVELVFAWNATGSKLRRVE